MKTLRKDLLHILDALTPLTGKRTTLPILNFFHLEAKDGLLSVTATNMEEYQTLTAACEGNLEPCCIYAARLLAIRYGTSEHVTLKNGEGHVLMECGGKAKLKTLPADTYPPAIKDEFKTVGLNAADLADSVKGVSWITPPHTTNKPHLDCVHIKTASKQIMAEACDGYTWAFVIKPSIAADTDWLLPLAYTNRFYEALHDKDAILSIGQKYVRVCYGNNTYAFRMLEDAKYPDTTRLMKDNKTLLGRLLPKDVTKLLSMALAMSSKDPYRPVDLKFSPKGLEVIVHTEDTDWSDSVKGDFKPHHMRINLTYLNNAISALEPENAITVSIFDNGALYLEQGELTLTIAPLKME